MVQVISRTRAAVRHVINRMNAADCGVVRVMKPQGPGSDMRKSTRDTCVPDGLRKKEEPKKKKES